MTDLHNSEPKETSENFYRFFQSAVAALQQHIDRLGDTALAGGERNDATEHCVAGIQRLSDEVKNASVYIPARDQRTYLESLRSLNTRLQETREAHAPKPKFAFKTARKRPSAMSLSDAAELGPDARLKPPDSRGNSEYPSPASSMAPTPAQIRTPPNEPDTSQTAVERQGVSTTPAGGYEDGGEDDEPLDTEALARKEAMIRKMSFSQASSVRISRQNHSHIILPPSAAHATTTGTLSNLRRCVIDMSVPTASTGRPFAGLTLMNVKESLVICGRVAGALHVTQLQDCVIVAACRQFRMHECKRCDVYLLVASRPIIEDCEGVRFAPIPDCYTGEQQTEEAPENQWEQVDDFKWLRSEPSPNWTTLPPDERVSDQVWTRTVPGQPGTGVSAILQAVGVRRT